MRVKIKIPYFYNDIHSLIYKYNPTYRVTLTADPTHETKHQIGMALTFLECAHFIKGIDHHHTTAYIVGLVVNLASWERGYTNCNSTYPVKASTLSSMRLAASKTAA